MSMFQPMNVNCPECGASVEFEAVLSVNADRRPDLRAAIINGSFQRQSCPTCGKDFRLDPEMSYVDLRHGQWLAAFPFAKLGHWRELEDKARMAFAQAYGPKAPAGARQLGAGLKPRITFGWGALREKLVAADSKLDDVSLELAKLAIVRSSQSISLSSKIELRFAAMEGQQLAMTWMDGQTERVVESLRVPRKLYDDVVADQKGWLELRTELSAGLFVDTNRLLVPAA